MTMLPSSSSFCIRSVEIEWMRALVCVLSVLMPICAPVRLIALAPSEWIAIAIKATLTCSPVESSMSISRAFGLSVICRARSMRWSVLWPIALTTITTWLPCCCARIALRGGENLLRVGDARAAELLHDQTHSHSIFV